MSRRPSREVTRFRRAGHTRLDEAAFLLTLDPDTTSAPATLTTLAVYLAGYAVECLLKALVLASEPDAHHEATLETFRGAKAHDYKWLRSELIRRGIALPRSIIQTLDDLNWWTTDFRYDPIVVERRRASTFIDGVRQVVTWAEGRF